MDGEVVDFGGEMEDGLEERKGDFGVVVVLKGGSFSLEGLVDKGGDFGVVISFEGDTLSLVDTGGDFGVVVAFGGDTSAGLGFVRDGGLDKETVLVGFGPVSVDLGATVVFDGEVFSTGLVSTFDGTLSVASKIEGDCFDFSFVSAGVDLGETVTFDGKVFSPGLVPHFDTTRSIGFEEDVDPSDLTSRSGSSISSTSIVFFGVTSSTLTCTSSSTSGVPSLPPLPQLPTLSFFVSVVPS